MFRPLSVAACATSVLFMLVLVSVGCARKQGSPEADLRQLQLAFNLRADGRSPGNDQSSSGLASTAVEAIRAKDWVKAVPVLMQLRTMPELTPAQFEAVHNANGNAYVRLVEMADKGSAEAAAVLDQLKKASMRR
jgi:hypothetical protein